MLSAESVADSTLQGVDQFQVDLVGADESGPRIFLFVGFNYASQKVMQS